MQQKALREESTFKLFANISQEVRRPVSTQKLDNYKLEVGYVMNAFS